MTAHEFPGDAAGRSRQGETVTYSLYLSGEDADDCSDARARVAPLGSLAAAHRQARIHALPGDKIQIYRHDPHAPEELEIVCCYRGRAYFGVAHGLRAGDAAMLAARWFADCCVVDPNGRITVDDVYASAVTWSGTGQRLRLRLTSALGYMAGQPDVTHTTDVNVFEGVRLREAGE